MKIADIAQFVTSKNAGLFLLTVDIVFRHAETYDRFKALQPLTKAGVAELYGLEPDQVLDIIAFDPAYASKITMRRPWGSGAIGAEVSPELVKTKLRLFDLGGVV